MSYIFKEKFNIAELIPVSAPRKKILVLEPEYYLRGLFYNQLKQKGFEVFCSESLVNCQFLIKASQPDLLVMSPHAALTYENFLEILAEIRNKHQSLPILTVGERLPNEVLSSIMDLGVTSHLERALSRPKDLILIINTIL